MQTFSLSLSVLASFEGSKPNEAGSVRQGEAIALSLLLQWSQDSDRARASTLVWRVCTELWLCREEHIRLHGAAGAAGGRM